MLTVKEVSEELALSEHTIRFYTDEGLVPSVIRGQNNRRLFDENAINCLIAIKHLRKTGMPLGEIKTYIHLCLEGDTTIPERHHIMTTQRDLAKLQLEEAQQRLAFLEMKVDIYDDILAKKRPDMMNPRNWASTQASS